ncbi:TPA: ead/Ea22-like family protein [Serratia marcescens]|nr:ead/Ea22-like family protein [Serratia marcescens]
MKPMDKLSELKAAALAATPGPWRALSFDERLGISGDGNAILVCEHITKQRPQDALFIAAANPAVVLALLAELEAKMKHIADMGRVVAAAKCDDELWDAMAHRLKTLEDKLATPVRLQSPWVDKVGNRWLLEGTTADAIRASGFAVTVEGDE